MDATTPPAEGERRALRGYERQYQSAAAAIYAALDRGELLWVGLADRAAGIADDVVLGFPGRVVGHQFKTSQFPGRFTLQTLLMGAGGLLKPLADAWRSLKSISSDDIVEIRLVTNDYPSTRDTVGTGSAGHSAALLAEFDQHPGRTLAEWRATRWQQFIDALWLASGLDEPDFEQFLHGLRLLHGPAADFAQFHGLSPEGARLAKEIANLLPQLVADRRNKDRWSREELLHELKWRDSTITRHSHLFPIGAHVQRNVDTEEALRNAIRGAASGYVALVGPPGAGKSTLLQTALATEAGLLVVRYLAYVPGGGQGVGRGEADDFLADIATQLKNSGLAGVRFRDDTLPERREQFGALLRQAGERYQRAQVRTLIVVDGLDHVPREEKPQRSFLAELPLPESTPNGVLFVLGTQRLDLQDLVPAVRDQANAAGRNILVSPLKREAVYRMADLLALDASIPRERVFELSDGHPLVTRYVIEALREADDRGRAELLSGAMRFEGDIEAIYESAWRGIKDDDEARDVLGYIARAEGPIPLELLAKAISEPAIERALESTRHLLTQGSLGWSVFHNSFRLFIIEKPRLRLGTVDTEYSTHVYRELAKLAKTAPHDTPQRWLELRYLARAQDQAGVLQLAHAERFRHQLAEGRSFSELHADIRLALAAAKVTHDATIAMRLLLARDEIGRRSTALEEATGLTEALLAVGDLDAAQSFAEEYGSGGYKVVDALISVGEYTRARDLFEKLEPLQQLLTGRLDIYGFQQNHAEFVQWARRAFHFRDIEQINQAIERLSSAGHGHSTLGREEAAAELAASLRYEVVLAIMATRPDSDPTDLCRQLGVHIDLLPDLLVHAGLRAQKQGSRGLATALLRSAASHACFPEVANAWRRSVALFAAGSGDVEMAHAIFDGLAAPAISTLDNETGDDAPEHIARAVMEHAQLATLVGRPVADVVPSKRLVLRPLQVHANAIGVLLGRAQAAGDTIGRGEVARVASRALSYLERAKPRGGDEFFAIRQIATATPVLGAALIQAAVRCGAEEFRLVLAEFDRAFQVLDPSNGILTNLQREVAVAIYRANGDTDEASRRIEPLVASLREDTPSAQLDGLASLAIAFAQVGNQARARDLLDQVPAHSLGYALPPKKDPQYSTWMEFLTRADAADPAHRGERVAFLMRQVGGMMETEGRSAAYRVASTLIAEATLHNAETGIAVARALSDNGAIGWPNLVDALLLGMIKRRPDLITACGIAWCSLALPFYMEPYFRESHLGEFVETAVALVPEGEGEALVKTLRTAIEAQSRAHERSALLQKLHSSARQRGWAGQALDDALLRWKAESPPPRHSYTAMKYDGITTLSDLETAFELESSPDGPGYEAPRAFDRLAPAAGFDAARKVFERWAILRKESRSRFLLVDLAIEAGREDYARQLVADYEASPDERATWAEWTGGGTLRRFRACAKLYGPHIHPQAYEHFLGSLTAGRESITSVMLEIADILPVVAQSPDWAAIWDWLAEQLATTREYSVGPAFEAQARETTDEAMIAALFRWALAIPLAELQRQAQIGVLHINATVAGQSIFSNFVRALLSGDADEPAQALQLLLLDASESQLTGLRDAVAALVDHPDYAVAEAAMTLSNRWGHPALMTQSALPSFYALVLEDHDDGFDAPTLTDHGSGAMRVEDSMGWTAMFPAQVNSLARQHVTAAHIRHRSRMFIEQWGGLAAFGKAATDHVQADLCSLKMRMRFWRPHVMVAARALRYVAGELRRGGMIPAREAPLLLHSMNFPVPTLPLIAPVARPLWMLRPTLDEGSRRGSELAEKWVQGVESDTAPLTWSDAQVIAEISTFEIHMGDQARYSLKRVRAPFLEVGNKKDFTDWIDLLPTAIWADGVHALTNEPAPTIVRRLLVTYMPAVPPFQLIICPHWQRQLGWRLHPENWLVYLDDSGQVVARAVWWRDGGPVDIEDDSTWGEGVYISVTSAGLAQIEAIGGSLRVLTHASRNSGPGGGDAEPLARSASRHE
jgi:hypothetical protein